MPNKSKLPDLLLKLNAAVSKGRLRFSHHARERMLERDLIRLDVETVLKNGFHEKRKDKFDEEFESWNYAVRGITIDNRSLRIIVSFEQPNFIVVTAIDLER